MRENAGKMWTRITPNTDSFYAVSNVDMKNITNNKTFCKTVNPFMSDKVISTQKITLTDNDKTIKNTDDTARALN